MKILIVDDSENKLEEIKAVLNEVDGPMDIETAKSFRGAVRCLEQRVFDVLILDLLLPIRDDETPSLMGGKMVLAEIRDGEDCHHPSHIICVTAYADAATTFHNEAEKRLVHVVVSDQDNKWKIVLKEKFQSIASHLSANELQGRDFKTDLVILTSSPLVELQEVLKLPGFIGEFNQADALDYYKSEWDTSYGVRLKVVACAAPHMGMTSACVTACKAIERWRPRYLAMSGMAAGTGGAQEYGDILVAEAAYDYGSGKIVDTEHGRVFTPSHRQLPIDAELFPVLQKWEREQLMMDVIQKQWYSAHSRTPRLIIGLLATGAAVVQDKTLVDEILKDSRKVVGLDMEAYAIFQAARCASHPRPRAIVAKSVSDFADKRKDDKWQQYAAFTSARFLYQFFLNAGELAVGSESR